MLASYNLPTRDLLPRLGINPRIEAPPGALPMRTALVRHNTESTYVVPGDWPAVDGAAWFHDGTAPASGSDVEYLIDGPRTFAAMVEAMETATSAGHFIILLGWSLAVDFDLSNGKTFLQIVEERAKRGVSVRVLLFDNTQMFKEIEPRKYIPLNTFARGALNKLRTEHSLDVYCNLDDNTKGGHTIPRGISEPIAETADLPGVHSYGAHHHKILLVHGREGLIGFCGGIDLDPNRLGWLHDVHLRVTGHAAKELLRIAELRWASAADDDNPPVPSAIATLSPPSLSSSGSVQLARVVQTVGNPDLSKHTANTLWPAVREAVRRASRFIYIEDQYLMSIDLVTELVEAAKRVKHITIVVPPLLLTELTVAKRRQFAMRQLVRLGGPEIRQKVAVLESTNPSHTFVHAKLLVLDDEFAIVGSANANNRGYFLDSEADVCVAEREWKSAAGTRAGAWFAVEANFARRLRVELWQEHLQLPPEELFDGVAARVHWDSLPPTALVRPYRMANLRKCLLPGVTGRLEKSADVLGPDDQSPWWEAPYAEWEPYGSAEDLVVDPKD